VRPGAGAGGGDGGGHPARFAAVMPGQVVRVRMKNLRCHRNAEVSFEPHLNFIVGSNGSGKSTILTAIRLAMGMEISRDKETGVSQSVISAGSDGEAVVEVTFSNTGTGSLPQDRFGPMFMVRRTMSLVPGDGHKVTDKYSVWRCTGRGQPLEDLKIPRREMVTFFAELHMWHDNPVTILTQETGKLFFSSQPARQYEFFMQATGLQRQFEVRECVCRCACWLPIAQSPSTFLPRC